MLVNTELAPLLSVKDLVIGTKPTSEDSLSCGMGPGWGIFLAGAMTLVAALPKNMLSSSGRACKVVPGSDMGLRGRGRPVMNARLLVGVVTLPKAIASSGSPCKVHPGSDTGLRGRGRAVKTARLGLLGLVNEAEEEGGVRGEKGWRGMDGLYSPSPPAQTRGMLFPLTKPKTYTVDLV